MDAGGARPILARASHLPQMVASALGGGAGRRASGRARWRRSTARADLRDTTRIAASSAEMWRDICLTNRDAIIDALGLFRGALDEFERAIRTRPTSRAFEEIFDRGRMMRERL